MMVSIVSSVLCKSKIARLARLLVVLLGLSAFCALPRDARADGSPFQEGTLSFGLSGGGGRDGFNISGRIGYFVIDNLRVGGSFQYSYQRFNIGEGHFLEPGVDFRYYINLGDTGFALFPLLELGYVNFRYSGTGLPAASYSYGTVAPGGGLFARLGRNVGLEIFAAALFFYGEDEVLNTSGVVPTDAQLRWGFGVSFFF